jgi:hypothetical protein
VDEQGGYNREKVEYGYHLLTQAAGIEMMECKLMMINILPHCVMTGSTDKSNMY